MKTDKTHPYYLSTKKLKNVNYIIGEFTMNNKKALRQFCNDNNIDREGRLCLAWSEGKYDLYQIKHCL